MILHVDGKILYMKYIWKACMIEAVNLLAEVSE